MPQPRIVVRIIALGLFFLLTRSTQASALEVVCDPAFENCRTPLLDLIKAEQVRIDVAFWFMEDQRYVAELVRRKNAGVPIRLIIDPRANPTYPFNKVSLDTLTACAAAGDPCIPARKRTAGGILHWKFMVFHGQGTVQFSGANYSDDAFVPVTPYTDYVDEAIYFTDKPSIVQSFMSKYDDAWTNTTSYADYANITAPPTRVQQPFSIDTELNFPPGESYATRAVSRYNAETLQIDVTMYRITDRRHSDAMIAAHQRGIPIRLYSDTFEYRNPSRLWHSWNIDRMWLAGIPIRIPAHSGLNHQKSIQLHGQALTIFGSSNWTSPSANSQAEHNYFTTDPVIYSWFAAQFERKWNNLVAQETKPFVPLPPDTATYKAPKNVAVDVATSGVNLEWYAGPWAHIYDVYFGTTSDPPLLVEGTNLNLGPSQWSSDRKKFALPALEPGTTYYWKIVSKTMAMLTKTGPVWSFTTAGVPPSGGPLGPGDVILYPSQALVRVGNWNVNPDSTAATGTSLLNPNASAAKISPALANPASYFEMTFTASANTPYRLWMRGKATNNSWANDSAHVQFDQSVTSAGAATYRIGTTSSTSYTLEDCSGCGVSGWGWQDNGYGAGVLGPLIYFAASGPQTIRIQQREDGLALDQILLSPERYLTASPGFTKNDNTILQ